MSVTDPGAPPRRPAKKTPAKKTTAKPQTVVEPDVAAALRAAGIPLPDPPDLTPGNYLLTWDPELEQWSTRSIVDTPLPEPTPGLNPDGPREGLPLEAFLPEQIQHRLILGPMGQPGFLDPQACYGDPHGAATLIRDLVALLRERAKG